MRAFPAAGETTTNKNSLERQAPPRRLWVKLGGKGRSATRLVVPNEQTLAGVSGRSLQCHNVWPGRALQDGVPRPTNVRAATMYQAFRVERFCSGPLWVSARIQTDYRKG